MIRLEDIMTRDVIAVSPDTTIREAMDLFTAHHVSGVPVLAGARVVGIVSAADLLAFASSLPAGVVSRFPEPEGSDWEAPADWAEAASGAFFADEWGAEGAPNGEYTMEAAAMPRNVLEEHTVADAMTRTPLFTMPPNTPVPAAAELMRRAHVHRVLVMESGKLVGIVTALDIVRAVAEGRLTVRTFVFPDGDAQGERPGAA
jgi:CBS domain-containing protein